MLIRKEYYERVSQLEKEMGAYSKKELEKIASISSYKIMMFKLFNMYSEANAKSEGAMRIIVKRMNED